MVHYTVQGIGDLLGQDPAALRLVKFAALLSNPAAPVTIRQAKALSTTPTPHSPMPVGLVDAAHPRFGMAWKLLFTGQASSNFTSDDMGEGGFKRSVKWFKKWLEEQGHDSEVRCLFVLNVLLSTSHYFWVAFNRMRLFPSSQCKGRSSCLSKRTTDWLFTWTNQSIAVTSTE